MEEAVSYVSLALSLTAFSLFVYNGFEDADTVHRDTRLLETSKVWHYNSTTGVASLDESVQTACVGLTPEACLESTASSVSLALAGGLRLGAGGPVLRHAGTGRVRAEDGDGNTVFLADLNTGAVLVGQDDLDLPQASGVRVVGKPVVGTQQDSDNWAASDGFELFSPGSTEAYAMVHRIVHKEDASIVGVRISPVVPVAAPERSLHVTPLAIVVGDASAAFIRANAGTAAGANVLVYGSAYVDPGTSTTEFPTCTTVPVDLADLYSSVSVAWRAVHVQVESCAQAGGLVNASVLASGADFSTCQGGFIYFNDGTSRALGQCSGNGDIYYCKAGVTV